MFSKLAVYGSFVNILVSISDFDRSLGLITIPYTADAALLSQKVTFAPLSTASEKSDKLVTRRLSEYTQPLLFALEPLALIYFATGIYAFTDAMSPVFAYFSNVLMSAMPVTPYLEAVLEDP